MKAVASPLSLLLLLLLLLLFPLEIAAWQIVSLSVLHKQNDLQRQRQRQRQQQHHHLPSTSTTTTATACSRQQRRFRFLHVTSKECSSSSSSSCSALRMAVGSSSSMDAEEKEPNLEYLKTQLLQYLEKRKEVGADELAKEQVGRVIGGTKGNKVLEYVSAAPNKASQVKYAPNALDYDELTKYGYGDLVTPIMEAGGRLAMYQLLEMERPDTSTSLTPTGPAPKFDIDRTGASDPARYKGLKLGQTMDDDMLGEALREAQRKRKSGETLRPTLVEETFERPFADKRNTGPRETPYWTPERLDARGRQQGQLQDWSREAKAGTFATDAEEILDLDATPRAFSILTVLLLATAYGQSTKPFLMQFVLHTATTTDGVSSSNPLLGGFLDVLQVPALACFAASLGSLVFCFLQAQEKNRNSFVWAAKGFLGGPFSVRRISELPSLVTQAEREVQQKAEREDGGP